MRWPRVTHKRIWLAALAVGVMVCGATLKDREVASQFYPHAACYRWSTPLLAGKIGADIIIWLSYFAVAFVLYKVARASRGPAWVQVAFAAFTLACGTTHLMDVIVLWYPLNWLDLSIRWTCAVLSIVSTAALLYVLPKLLKDAATT